jgi:hypothetical protein
MSSNQVETETQFTMEITPKKNVVVQNKHTVATEEEFEVFLELLTCSLQSFGDDLNSLKK